MTWASTPVSTQSHTPMRTYLHVSIWTQRRVASRPLKRNRVINGQVWGPATLLQGGRAWPMFKIEVFNALQTRFGLQSIPHSKQPFRTQPHIENEDITWSPQCNMPTTWTNKHRALSPQEVKLDGWFLIHHIVLKTCTIYFKNKFNMGFVFHFYIFGATSWIWTNPSAEGLKFESPSKWNAYEGFKFWTLTMAFAGRRS